MRANLQTALDKSILDDLFMVCLALIDVFLLFFEVLSAHTPEQTYALQVADTIIACIFLTEFCVRFFLAENKTLFFRKYWWELLASIPINDLLFQALRGLRIVRIVRLLRLLRFIRFLVRFRIVLEASARFAEKTYLLYIATLAGIVVMSAALGFYYLEVNVNENVNSLWDSFWWTIVTITTVGYGDIYPVTTAGRILAIALMLGGIATFSSITAAIAAYAISKNKSTAE
ncbi:ion transporter [Synechococcus elongatus IITB3]